MRPTYKGRERKGRKEGRKECGSRGERGDIVQF